MFYYLVLHSVCFCIVAIQHLAAVLISIHSVRI